MTTSSTYAEAPAAPVNSPARVATASFIGTAIEFYDFYVYATAAALVIGPVFFPSGSGTAQMLAAFLTFGIAFLARPLGSALFGHFGDRIGRKSTLVASLLLMGVSTTAIGVLPGYDSIGVWAPIILCLLRFGQGLGLGGEWGGAALLATENAPEGKRAWFGMFPQLGPSIGFLAANGLFLTLALVLSDEQFREWGWRIPFLLSAALVLVGLYVRLKLEESPVFAKAVARHERVKMPVVDLFSRYWLPTLLGAAAMVVCYALFYISTVFSLSYGVTTLGYSRETFLGLLCFAVVFMALATPLSAWLSDRYGRKPVLIVGGLLAVASGFTMEPLLTSGSTAGVALFLAIELFLMGVTFAPMGALLPELFPTHVRYTGASAAYNLGGIVGASAAPFFAQKLVSMGGLSWVGGYVSVAAVISLIAVLCLKETRNTQPQSDQNSTLTACEARVALARAASTDSSRARHTPMRRVPLISGLPNRRMAVSGSLSAAPRLAKLVCCDCPSGRITAEAEGPNWRTTGIGRPRMARACRANCDRSWEIRVTRPVSCGRGETSLNHTWSPFTNSSTPNRPRPPRASVTALATRCDSASAFGLMACGCHDSW